MSRRKEYLTCRQGEMLGLSHVNRKKSKEKAEYLLKIAGNSVLENPRFVTEIKGER